MIELFGITRHGKIRQISVKHLSTIEKIKKFFTERYKNDNINNSFSANNRFFFELKIIDKSVLFQFESCLIYFQALIFNMFYFILFH